ncbi:hypothetical protein JCM3766R1_000256 [Sporobolomyces carnicolor]
MWATEGQDAPHISVVAGVTVGLVASLVQSFGLTIQRLSHVANEKLPLTERKRDWQRPLWLGGFAIFILSNVFGTLFQIGALPIVVLGPLGAVSLLWNAAFAKLVLGDEFTIHLVVGTILIAGGAVLIGIFGVVPEQTHTLPELVRLYRRPAFIVWVTLLASFLVVILFAAHVTEWRLSRRRRTSELSIREGPTERARSRASLDSTRERDLAVDAVRSCSSSSSPTTSTEVADATETTRLVSPRGRRHKRSDQFRLSFAENEIEADSNNVYSPAPSIVGGGRAGPARRNDRPRRGWGQGVGSDDDDDVPDEPLLRRIECDAAKTKLWVGAAYGATSGTLSGLCLLFTKTGIELLIMSIVGKSNQFGHFEAWLIVIVLLVCELCQLTYLNRALRLVGPTLVCPLAFCFYNTCSIMSGLIYYDQWDELSSLKLGLVILGIAVLLGGVWIVSIKSGTEDDDAVPALLESGSTAKEVQDADEAERLIDRQERYFDEPESDLDRDSDAEERTPVAEDDEPLEWRPRGFSIGLAASSPGFDLRPHHHRRARRKKSDASPSLPHHSTLDALLRDANDTATPFGDDDDDDGNESVARRRKSTSLAQSRPMRGSLSGSLYVGPAPTCPSTASGHGHRRNRSSGTTVSLPTTPPAPHRNDDRGGRDVRETISTTPESCAWQQSSTRTEWWKFWSSSRRGKIALP